MYRVLLILIIACLTGVLSSCSFSQEPKGLELVLRGVDKNYEKIFQDNFKMVQEGHENLIYRKSDTVRKLTETFPRNRPDLKNARLIYDAPNNVAEFVYYYKPSQEDIDLESDLYSMRINLASYIFIGYDLGYYFRQCRVDLGERNIQFKYPDIFFTFFVSNDKYLKVSLLGSYQIVFYVKNPGDNPVTIIGDFPNRLQATIPKPSKSVSGSNSPETALLKFFGMKY